MLIGCTCPINILRLPFCSFTATSSAAICSCSQSGSPYTYGMAADSKPHLLVLDVPSLVHRAYHAIPQHFSTASGEPTNAVFGFVNMLIKLVHDLEPQFVVAAFDLPGDTFRHEKFAAYKANRPETDEALIVQFGRIRQVIAALGIPSLESPGFEADDVLGAMAMQGEAAGLMTLLVTGDRDAYQLIGPSVHVVSTNPRTGEPVIYDSAALRERWGIAPEQVRDFKGLVGDTSDNIPGVAGIGEKTASTLLQTYATLDEIYAHLDELRPAIRTKLESAREIAELSREIATIDRNVPVQLDLDRARLWQADRDTVRELFTELQFRGLFERLPFANEPSDPPPADPPAVLDHVSIADASDASQLAESLRNWSSVKSSRTVSRSACQSLARSRSN